MTKSHKRKEANKMLLFILFCLTTAVTHAKKIDVFSPLKTIKVSININKNINFDVEYEGSACLQSKRIGMTLRNQTMGDLPHLTKSKDISAGSTLRPAVPLKQAVVENRYNGKRLSFKGGYDVEFRVYDDAVAYRFVTHKKGDVEVMNESFNFSVPQESMVHVQQPGGFKTAYEEPYTHMKIETWGKNDKMATLPMLMETPQGFKVLVSEADVQDYPRMFLKGRGNEHGAEGVFPKVPIAFGEDGDRSVKILKEADYIAKTKGERAFPWRFFFITKDDKDILTQNMVDKLAAPSQINDLSWLKPGQVTWEWWNAASPYGEDVNFEAGFNMDTYKYYIDFAAKHGIAYLLMDEGWAKSTRDPYTPNPKVNAHEIIRYGKEKGVGIILWLTWLTVENNFDVFKTFADWGVAGLKIDFMDRSDQWMVNYYERVAREAAKHHLFVDMHGSFTPAGLERMYPNILSYEGVRGMEQMGGCTPDNSLYLPFMRNAVGAMDYTPGAMISMQPEVYCGERPNAASIGTRAYQMALYVVFESGLQMLADNPTMYYRNEACTEFITSVPTTWDETKVLDAKIGQYVVTAKRKGDKWFVGAFTNNAQRLREFEISLDFLKDNQTYHMTSFEDGINAGRQAMDYRKKELNVKRGDTVKIKLARNGGWCARIE